MRDIPCAAQTKPASTGNFEIAGIPTQSQAVLLGIPGMGTRSRLNHVPRSSQKMFQCRTKWVSNARRLEDHRRSMKIYEDLVKAQQKWSPLTKLTVTMTCNRHQGFGPRTCMRKVVVHRAKTALRGTSLWVTCSLGEQHGLMQKGT